MIDDLHRDAPSCWTGYIESDDSAYAGAALSWIAHFPFLGTDHHALRHVIVLPMAASLWMFGPSEFSLELPVLLYLAALLAVAYLTVAATAGFVAGLLTLLLSGTIPALVSGASVVTTDIPEAFFIYASVWAFLFAWRGERRWLFVVSGALAALGFITRETSAAVLVLYGILFLLNYGGSRAAYFWMAGGFVAIAGADMAALGFASGDPLYRFHVSLVGVAKDSPAMQRDFKTLPGVDRFGALEVARWLKPLVVAFLDPQFGVLGWFAVPACVTLTRSCQPSHARAAGRLLAIAGLVWFVTLFYGLYAYLNVIARYMDFTAIAAIVPLAIVLSRAWAQGRRTLVVACVGAIVSVNMALAVSFDNQIMFGEHALVAFARSTSEPILTDPATLRGAAALLDWEGLDGRAGIGLPRPGALYMFNSRPRRGIPGNWPVQRPDPGWQELARLEKPRKPLAGLAHMLQVWRYLPVGIAAKLDPPPAYVALYQTSAAAFPGLPAAGAR